MPLTDKLQFIRDNAKSILGGPIITSLDSTVEDIDLNNALLRYYTACPIMRTRTYDMNFNQEIVLSVNQLLDLEFPPVAYLDEIVGTANGSLTNFNTNIVLHPSIRPGTLVVKRAGVQVAIDDGKGNITGTDGAFTVSGSVNYISGNTQISYNSAPPSGTITIDYYQDNVNYIFLGPLNESSRSNISPQYNFDRKLLGVDVGFNYSDYGPLEMSALETSKDQFQGQNYIEYREDEGPKGTLRIICKMIGTISVTLGFGYTKVDKLPWRDLILFSSLVSEKLLERIIAIRSLVKLNADYEIDTSFIKQRYDDLHERNEQTLRDIAVLPTLHG